MRRQILFSYLIFLFVGTSSSSAQEPYIFSNDIFSGISNAGIHPTQTFLNPNYWDIHLISEDVFLQNSYGYISKSSLLNATQGEIVVSKNEGERKDKNVWNYYNLQKTGYHVSSDLMGPSASFKFKLKEKDFVVGVFTKLRTQSSIIEVDNYLQFENQQILEPVLFNLNPFDANFMNWSEVGINFATELFPNSEFQWIAGMNVKYLMGHDALYLKNKTDALMRRDFEPWEETDSVKIKNLYISDFDLEIGYATGYDFENDKYKYKKSGKGFGIDLGLTFIDRNPKEDDYHFKLSANIIDLGQINFEGFVHSFVGKDYQYTNNPNFDNFEFENPEQFAQIISEELYGNPEKSLISNNFKIGLPTRMHLNASQNIGFHKYLNANFIQRIPIFKNSLKPANILNLSYLFTNHLWAYGGSISLYEYKKLQIGGFFRWGPFVIGSENLLPLLIPQKKFHAFDFYFGIKIYPFRNRDMERRSREDCYC